MWRRLSKVTDTYWRCTSGEGSFDSNPFVTWPWDNPRLGFELRLVRSVGHEIWVKSQDNDGGDDYDDEDDDDDDGGDDDEEEEEEVEAHKPLSQFCPIPLDTRPSKKFHWLAGPLCSGTSRPWLNPAIAPSRKSFLTIFSVSTGHIIAPHNYGEIN